MMKNSENNGTGEIGLVTPTPGSLYSEVISNNGYVIFRIFSIAKTHVKNFISCQYLTGVAAAQRRWYLSNMNVIEIT